MSSIQPRLEAVLTVLRLPPSVQSVRTKCGDNILDAMVSHLLCQLIMGLCRVAHKTLLLLLVNERQRRRKSVDVNSSHSFLLACGGYGGQFLTKDPLHGNIQCLGLGLGLTLNAI